MKSSTFGVAGSRGKAEVKLPFYEEPKHTKGYVLAIEVSPNADHRPVVHALIAHLPGLRLGKDKRDLFVAGRSGRALVLFEVKTDTAASSMYTAIGQLMIYGLQDDPPPRRVLVAPSDVSESWRKELGKIGIEFLGYRWVGQQVVFTGQIPMVRAREDEPNGEDR